MHEAALHHQSTDFYASTVLNSQASLPSQAAPVVLSRSLLSSLSFSAADLFITRLILHLFRDESRTYEAMRSHQHLQHFHIRPYHLLPY